jgi:hypothetical protein
LSDEASQATEIDVWVEPVGWKLPGVDGGVVSGAAEAAGLNATSCPMLLRWVALVTATLSPVGPALVFRKSAPSDRTAPQPDRVETSYRSTVAAGGVAVPLPSLPKMPTTTAGATLVVIDGAEIDLLSGVNRPLCASTGAVWLTPPYAKMAPAA